MFVPAWILVLVLVTVFGAWGLVIEMTVLAVQAAWWCIKAPFRLAWLLAGLPFRFLRWMATGQFIDDIKRWRAEEAERERRMLAGLPPSEWYDSTAEAVVSTAPLAR